MILDSIHNRQRRGVGGLLDHRGDAIHELRLQQQYPRTAAEMAAAFGGRMPSDGWLCEDASGGMVAVFGGVDMSVNGSPGFQVSTPYSGKRGIAFSENSNDFEASSSSTFDDDGITSFGYLVHARFGTFSGAANRSLMGKREASVGWWLLNVQTDGDAYWHIYDGTLSKTATIAGQSLENVDTWIWVSVDRTAELSRVMSRGGYADISTTGVGSLSSGGVFSFGGIPGGYFSIACDLLAAYRFEGANAEGDPTAEYNSFTRYADAA